METIYHALRKNDGAVSPEIQALGWKVYPGRGATKVNCAEIAFPIITAVGATHHLEGGTVNGIACYVVRFADGAYGAVQGHNGSVRLWKYDQRNARTEAWATYRKMRAHAAFLPKNGETVQSQDYNYATAETALYNNKNRNADKRIAL
jgi:hypothetical protein